MQIQLITEKQYIASYIVFSKRLERVDEDGYEGVDEDAV
jgi:hypothetical protein